MTISYIRPIAPGTAPGNTQGASRRPVGQPLPLIAVLATPPPRQSNVLYGMAAVDGRGRVADRQLTVALNWNATTLWGVKTWLSGLTCGSSR